MEKIEKLEAAVGLPIEQWNVSDLEKFSLEENLELLQLLKDPEVISECVERAKKNQEVEDVLVPLYIKSLVNQAETTANTFLKAKEEKTITDEECKEQAEALLSGSVYHKLVAYLILISTFADYDLLSKEVEIKECIGQLKEVICGLVSKDLETCYTLIMDLIELLFPLRSKYFEKYNVDILDDEDKRMEQALDDIHSLEMMIMEELSAKDINEPIELPEAIQVELDGEDKDE